MVRRKKPEEDQEDGGAPQMPDVETQESDESDGGAPSLPEVPVESDPDGETTDEETEETEEPAQPERKPRTMPFRVLVGNLYHEGRKCRYGEIIHLTPEDRERNQNYIKSVDQ